MRRITWLVAGVVLVVGSVTSKVETAPPPPAASPTFAKDVAPIVFTKCAGCHRPGEVAPMSLLSFEDVRPWAKAIKTKVMAREMPPWGADPKESLKMRNDVSLSQEQIDTIVGVGGRGRAEGQRRRHAAGAEVHERLDPRTRAGRRPRDAGRVRHSRRRRARRADVLFEGAVRRRSLRRSRGVASEQSRGAASCRHLLRRSARRHARSRTGASLDRTASRSATVARAGCRQPIRDCPDRASCSRGCRAVASTSIVPMSASAFPPASTSAGRCTTTSPASRRRIAPSWASGSTRSR